MADRCPECGFDYDSLSPRDAAVALRSYARRYRAPLSRLLPDEDDSILRRRPDDSTWSALEYACHVRDVFDVYADRLRKTLVQDTPTFEPMGREERVERDNYNEQDPEGVAGELADNGERLAEIVEGVDAGDWERTAVHPYPEPAERTLLWMVRNAVHEGSHHLLDIGRVLRAARGR